MFKAIIGNSPLVNDIADDFFQNIRGDYLDGDISFIATLRALLAPRLPEGDKVRLRFGGSSYTAQNIRDHRSGDVVRAICGDFPTYEQVIYIHNLSSSNQDDNYACLDLLKANFTNIWSGWHLLDKVTDFYRKQFYVLCFINPELKSVAIFVDNLDIRRMHYLQCSIFAFLPWYFDPEKGVSELEMELIDSLREKTSNRYTEAMRKIAQQYDFRAAKIRKDLRGIETVFERAERENTRQQIQQIINQIETYNGRIAQYIEQKSDLEIRLLGLENKISGCSEDSEIMEYFLCNNKLFLLGVHGTAIDFAVKTYIEYFDEENASAVIGNKTSYVYQPDGESYDRYIPENQIEKLMTAIFIDQTLKIQSCAAYQLDLRGGVEPIGDYDFKSMVQFENCMPNPHINYYRCMGNYLTTINNLLSRDRNYIGAIEQCIASAKSLNFGDSTVMCKFMRTLYTSGSRMKFIELPDGTMATPKEAIAWIEAQEGEGESHE